MKAEEILQNLLELAQKQQGNIDALNAHIEKQQGNIDALNAHISKLEEFIQTQRETIETLHGCARGFFIKAEQGASVSIGASVSVEASGDTIQGDGNVASGAKIEKIDAKNNSVGDGGILGNDNRKLTGNNSAI